MIEAFIKRIYNKKSLNTAKTYQTQLKKWFPEEVILTPEYIDSKLYEWKKEMASQSTINLRLSILSKFIKFLELKNNELLPHSAELKEICSDKKKYEVLPKCMGMDKVNKIGEELKTNRDKAIYFVMAHTGMRIGEIVKLDLEDYDGNYIAVRNKPGSTTKSGKERVLPVPPIPKKYLDLYLKERIEPENVFDKKALFTTTQGRITISTIKAYINVLADMVGEDFTAHTLRHSYATYLLERGANIVEIQEMLGHSDLSTTRKYLHLSEANKEKIRDYFC